MDRYQEYRRWIRGLSADLLSVETRNLKFLIEEKFSAQVKTIALEKLKIIQHERDTDLRVQFYRAPASDDDNRP